jgi:O-antigen ligase
MSLRSILFSSPLTCRRLVPTGLAVALGLLLALHSPATFVFLGAMGGIAYLLFAVMSLREPLLFVVVFLLFLEIFPPIYHSQLGEKPVYASFLLLPIGIAITVFRLRDICPAWDPVAKGLVAFLAGTASSLPFAFWLSGIQTGTESLSRWLLLSQTAFIYFLIRGGARLEETRTERAIYPLLCAGAVLSAGYGIVDFIWPVPLLHPTPNQFVWLGTEILRRAQGVFYDSLNFANFCGFFLVPAAAALLARRDRRAGLPRWLLVLLTAVFGLAILVTFSRSTWMGIAVALLVFSLTSGLVNVRRSLVLCLALAVPLLLLWMYSPELWHYFLEARVGHLTEILTDPNGATSGRYLTWIRILDIIREYPQYLIFGIGYKTLTFTRLFHGELIADNGYLSLLLETGVVGLAGFLIFSGAILHTFSRLARQKNDPIAFWGAVMLSIWAGELIQLLAVDAYTFWRSMVILTALMALIMNRVERSRRPARLQEGGRLVV